MNPRDGQIDLQSAFALLKAGHIERAEAIARQARSRSKKDPLLHALLGQIAETRGQLDVAADHYLRSIKLDPRQPMTHVALGQVRTNQGRFADAVMNVKKALRLRPDLPHAIAALANAYEKQGDHERARETIRAMLESGTTPSPPVEVLHATILMNTKQHEAATRVAQGALQRSDLDANSRQLLGFALGRSLETLGRYDESFAAYELANQAEASVFDREAFARQVDDLIDVFSRRHLAALPRPRAHSNLPIFIAGMPRSGTTLVERILDAHPQIRGAGEITVLGRICTNMAQEISSDQPFPRCVLDADLSDVDRLGNKYLEGIRPSGRGVKRVTDKNLQNIWRLGVIALLLPHARVVHCRRDPVDTCFSCFTSALSTLTNPWASDLASIGFVYRQYERLMVHWSETLDLPMLEVVYEDMVENQETHSRRLIEFAGLDWDERCLRFFETPTARSGGIAPTLSYDQVRQPVYRSAIDRARPFAAHLEPLIQSLGPDHG